jgi:hypothetical protein
MIGTFDYHILFNKDESSLKSLFTPKSPKGDFFKLLIFSVLPLGLGVKTIKISSLGAF